VSAAALMGRRRHPEAAALVIGAASLLAPSSAVFLIPYAITRHGNRRWWGWAALILMTVAWLVGAHAWKIEDPYTGPILISASALLGLYVRARHRLVDELRERADRAERERDLRAQQARAEERTRLAADMHDVVTHRINLMVLQAGALEVSSAEPAVRKASRDIREAGVQALAEMRDLVGVLRSDADQAGSEATDSKAAVKGAGGEGASVEVGSVRAGGAGVVGTEASGGELVDTGAGSAGTSGAGTGGAGTGGAVAGGAGTSDGGADAVMVASVSPGGASLADLVAESAAVGLDVALHESGDAKIAAPTVRRALYRVVQESLTNVHKHAPGSVVRVDVRYAPHRIAVDIRNTAPAATPAAGLAATGGGNGLAGLTQRVQMLGGQLYAAPSADGGFAVRAQLPAFVPTGER
jgi:signal transduction histidine kinase